MEFGTKLKELRQLRRMNQKDLAKAAEIDVTYLSKLETGKMEPPAEATVRKLAAVLGVEPTELLILGKKIPSDVREIVTASPEVSYFLRTAKEWTPADWRRLREETKNAQHSLFDEAGAERPPQSQEPE